MKNFLLLVGRFLLLHFRRKTAFILLLVLPLFVFPASLLLFRNGSVGPPALGIYAAGSDNATAFLISALESGNKYQVDFLSASEGRRKAAAGDLLAMIVLPADTEKSVTAKTAEPFTLYSVYQEETLETLRNDINRYAEVFREMNRIAGIADENITVYLDEYLQSVYAVERNEVPANEGFFQAAVQGTGLLLILIMLQIFYTCSFQFEKKEHSPNKAAVLMPAGRFLSMGANAAASLVIAILQAFFAYVPALLVLDIRFELSIPVLAIYLFLFAVSVCTLAWPVLKVLSGKLRFYEIALIVIMPGSVLSGCVVPVNAFPGPAGTAAALFPQHWVLDAFNSARAGLPLGTLLTGLAILAGFSGLALLAGRLLHRYNTDHE